MDTNNDNVGYGKYLKYTLLTSCGILTGYGIYSYFKDDIYNYFIEESKTILTNIIKSEQFAQSFCEFLNKDECENTINELLYNIIKSEQFSQSINEFINKDECKLTINNILNNIITDINNNPEMRKQIIKFLKYNIVKLLNDETIKKTTTINVTEFMDFAMHDDKIIEDINLFSDELISQILNNNENKLKLENYIISIFNNKIITNSAEETIKNSALKLFFMK